MTISPSHSFILQHLFSVSILIYLFDFIASCEIMSCSTSDATQSIVKCNLTKLQSSKSNRKCWKMILDTSHVLFFLVIFDNEYTNESLTNQTLFIHSIVLPLKSNFNERKQKTDIISHSYFHIFANWIQWQIETRAVRLQLPMNSRRSKL